MRDIIYTIQQLLLTIVYGLARIHAGLLRSTIGRAFIVLVFGGTIMTIVYAIETMP